MVWKSCDSKKVLSSCIITATCSLLRRTIFTIYLFLHRGSSHTCHCFPQTAIHETGTRGSFPPLVLPRPNWHPGEGSRHLTHEPSHTGFETLPHAHLGWHDTVWGEKTHIMNKLARTVLAANYYSLFSTPSLIYSWVNFFHYLAEEFKKAPLVSLLIFLYFLLYFLLEAFTLQSIAVHHSLFLNTATRGQNTLHFHILHQVASFKPVGACSHCTYHLQTPQTSIYCSFFIRHDLWLTHYLACSQISTDWVTVWEESQSQIELCLVRVLCGKILRKPN